MGFSRQGYWSGLPFPFPGDLPDPGICHLTTLREKSTHWWRLQPSGEPLGEGRDGTPSKELHEDKNFLNTKTLIWKGAHAPMHTKTLIWKGAQAPVLTKTLIWKGAQAQCSAALFTTANTGEQRKCRLTEEWVKKVQVYA